MRCSRCGAETDANARCTTCGETPSFVAAPRQTSVQVSRGDSVPDELTRLPGPGPTIYSSYSDTIGADTTGASSTSANSVRDAASSLAGDETTNLTPAPETRRPVAGT